MRQSKLRAVSARPWLLLLCLALAATAGVMQARAQPNSIGFISIDCGFPGTTSYVDDATTLPYAPDAAFTDAGENHNVSSEHVTPELPRIYRDVRSFVDGARNCYTLPSTLAVGLNKYLFRAAFMYGNYDGLNRPPVFDLYIGVNLWKTVNLSSSDPAAPVIAEAIVVVPDDFVQVCLVNTGTGTPFISGLELRPLKNSIYPQVNATQGLVLQSRRNFGPTDMTDIIRDLSHNNLTGSIPSSLSQLPSLTTLDLTGNQLSGPIPSSLLKRIQDGSLNLIYADNPDLCTNAGDSCQTAPQGKSKLVIYYVAVPMALIVVALAVLLCCLLRRRKTRGLADVSVKPRDKTPTSLASMAADEHRLSSLRLENRRFTYEDLEMITDSFKRVIGRGGFGYVYEGFLEDGTQVAVKMRSQSSNQGAKEFLTEAQILTRIHHKNLVSMVGYCKDGVYMALVYEYMSEGSLQEHIAGKRLTWGQRLRIALESAQGLEYLHRGCNPPLIHRDVKTSNILLNAKLEAKVADFGMSKALDRDTYASTNTLVGTPGYVDPEYQETMQPSTKSDVYSFGVVLLELVTGRPPILHGPGPQPTSVIQWTRQHLARGDIEAVVDASIMGGSHDVNGVWKAAEVALQCTEQASAQRPTMADVVAQLLECLDLEKGRAANESFCDGDDSGSATASMSQSSAFVTGRIFGTVPMVETGPATR